MNLTDPERTSLQQVLRSLIPDDAIPEELKARLLQTGAVRLLHEDAGPQAVEILTQTVYECPSPEAVQFAFSALADLAAAGNQPAVEALFTLAVEHDDHSAAEFIQAHRLQSLLPQTSALQLALTKETSTLLEWDTDLSILSAGFLQSAPEVQNRVIRAAQRTPLQGWSSIVQAIQLADTDSLESIVRSYYSYTQIEKNCALALLTRLAIDGSTLAADVICKIAVQYEDAAALSRANENAFLPADQIQKALFLFLTGRWDEYEVFDFNYTLLGAAYEAANPSLRQRILAHARKTGHSEWFNAASQASSSRHIDEMTFSDWRSAIQNLSQKKALDELWLLSQSAPPAWSCQMLQILARHTWQPPNSEIAAWQRLLGLAQQAFRTPIAPLERKKLHSPAGDATCLALSPTGRHLALGSSGQQISVWRLPAADQRPTIILSPNPQIRALAYSPSGEYLVAACGDHALRIFRSDDGRLVKTLEGHAGLVRTLSVLPDERTLLSAGFDGTLRSWRFPQGGEPQILRRASNEIFSLAVTHDAGVCLTAGADACIDLRHLPDGAAIGRLQGHSETITSLAAARQSALAASASRDRTLRIWNTASQRFLSSSETGADLVTALAWHPGDSFLASANTGGGISIFQPLSSELLSQVATRNNPVSGLAFTPDGTMLISTGLDGEATLFDFTPLLLVHSPLGSLPETQLATLERLHHPAAHFVREMLRWKHRFDIQIDHSEPIHAGEFDIIL